MKLLIPICIFVVSLTISGTRAYAHVLISDEQNSVGAVLHITPDDDPVAGEKAQLFLNTQDLGIRSGAGVSLTVTDASDNDTIINTIATRTYAGFTYTFPRTGLYRLSFDAVEDSKGRKYSFKYDLRVSRGNGASTSTQKYGWAEPLTAFSISGIIVMLIVAFNRRHDISKQSKF